MIRAYNEILLNKAADSLGRMMDFSIHSMHMSADAIMSLFVASGTAALFERGDVKIICGMSGVELSYELLERSGINYERTSPRHTASLSPEYWFGYALAHLQWSYAKPFAEILSVISAEEMTEEYKRCRSLALDALSWDASDEDRAAAISSASEEYMGRIYMLFEERLAGVSDVPESSSDTTLKKMRIKNGLSQSDLAAASGVPVRTIQQYEQRRKDINKARAEYLIMLSRALNCRPELILDR